MSCRIVRITVLFFLTLSRAYAVDSPHVRIASVPDWIRVRPAIDDASVTPDDSGQGLYYLLADRQSHAEKQEAYSRIAYRVTSSSGLQNASQVSFSFDPAYQTIDLHTLVVWRNGRSENRLLMEKMQILQQERDLERHQYNGQLTALFLLEDVRVGDLVEYAFTRRGENPIFGRHYMDLQLTNWGSAIREQWVRVLVDGERHFAHQQLGGAPLKVAVRSEGTLLEYEWEAKNQKPAEFEAGAPSWFLPLSMLEISDFENWQGVVEWARPLYAPTSLSDALRAKAQELTSGLQSDRERAVAILDFVQRDIRYLGIELGPRSHAPNDPNQTFRLRYGDCKDKVRLLCALLNEVGISAVPALTHSRYGKKLNHWLPGIGAFDHVIARIDVVPLSYWVDPTLTDQAGSLEYRALPEYGWALPVEAGSAALQRVTNSSVVDHPATVPPPSALVDEFVIAEPLRQSLLSTDRSTSRTKIRVHESFSVGEPGGPAELTVKSTYSGLAADGMRSYLRETPPEQVGKHLLNFRTKIFSNLKLVANPTWTEDRRVNNITVEHRYHIPELWRKNDDSPVLQAEFYPLNLRDYVSAPETIVRTAPYAVPFPLHIVCETDLHLTNPWPIKAESRTITDPAFEGRFSARSSGNTVHLRYEFSTSKDVVQADRMNEFAANLQEFRGTMGYSLTFNPEVAKRNAHFRFNWIQAAVAGVSLIAWSMLAFWVSRRPWRLHPPSLLAPYEKWVGVSGWLVVVGLSIFARTVSQAILIGRDHHHFLDLRTWEAISVAMQCIQLLELVGQLGLLVCGVLSIVTFIQHRPIFPVIFITHFAAIFLFTLFDTIAAANVGEWGPTESTQAFASLAQISIAGCIWIPYMFMSRRVKATFTSEPAPAPVSVEPPPLVGVTGY